jgi:hypothetical protein
MCVRLWPKLRGTAANHALLSKAMRRKTNRYDAAAAGFPSRDIKRVSLDMPVLGQRLGVAGVLGRIGQEKFRGGHTERIEQVRLLELIERLPDRSIGRTDIIALLQSEPDGAAA